MTEGTTAAPTPEERLEALERRLDHFKLYDFLPVPVAYRALLEGQFDTGDVEVYLRELDHLGPPVRKTRPGEEPTGVVDRNAHILMYRAPSYESYRYRLVTIFNQFGRREYELGRAVRMITPAEKFEEGSALVDGLNHYKVYDILSTDVLDEPVTLSDQFTEAATVVREPRFFCVPVAKVVGPKRSVTPIADAEAHLTIYGIDMDEIEETREVEDQFGRLTVTAVRGVMLAVPTLKLAVVTRRADRGAG